jgi:hypothetical protein
MSRPKSAPSAEQLDRIRRLAGVGCTLDQIAMACDVSEATIKRWRKDPQVDRAYQQGRIAAHEAVAEKLFNLCMAGDTAACIFWLKAQSGWRDKPEPESPVVPGQVVVYLPENGR